MSKFPPLLLLLAAGLSACTLQEDGRPAMEKPRATQAFPVPEPRPAHAEPVQRQAKPADKRVLKVEPARLVGLSEQETIDLLGRPAEESEQPPGKVWTYRASGCRLSVHFFPDVEKGVFTALDTTAEEGAGDICLGKLATSHRRD